MRAIRTYAYAAGLLGLAVAISGATAEQLDWDYPVEPARFVAPEPTPADAAYDTSSPFVHESGTATGTGYAFAEDGACPECCFADPCRVLGHRAGRRLIGSTCNMGQHHAYFPPMHGYYYFHPYHHSHIWNHQSFARMWGEDPANPYANRLFQTVYEQYRADVLLEQPAIEE